MRPAGKARVKAGPTTRERTENEVSLGHVTLLPYVSGR